MKKLYRVVIPPTAKKSLRDIVNYLKKDSPVAAVKVQKELIKLAKSLSDTRTVFQRRILI